MNPATALVILNDIAQLFMDGRNKPGIEAVLRTAVEVLKELVEKAEKESTNGNDPEPAQ